MAESPSIDQANMAYIQSTIPNKDTAGQEQETISREFLCTQQLVSPSKEEGDCKNMEIDTFYYSPTLQKFSDEGGVGQIKSPLATEKTISDFEHGT